MSEPIALLKDRLREALEIRGIKQIELAEKTKLSRAAINQYLSGYTMPKSDRIHKIATALGVTEAWLMGFDTPMEQAPVDTALIQSYRIKNAIKDLNDEQALELIEMFSCLDETHQELVLNLIRSLLPSNLTKPQ